MQDFPAIRLVIPTRAAAAFDDPDWVFELKHDDFRALSYIADGRCDLISRKNNRYKSFTDLRTEMAHLPVQNAILDGEIVCLDSAGRSQFNELLHRRGNPVFYAFDLLWLNGDDFDKRGKLGRNCFPLERVPGRQSRRRRQVNVSKSWDFAPSFGRVAPGILDPLVFLPAFCAIPR